MLFGFRSIAVFIGVAASLFEAINASAGTDAITNLSHFVGDLDSSIANWNGKPLGTIIIAVKAQKILKEVDKTTELFKDAGKRTVLDERDLITAAAGAVKNLGQVTTTLLAAKDQFFKLPMGSAIVFGILKALESSANTMTQQIVSGAPFGLEAEEKALQNQVQELFKHAIASFE